MLATEDGIEVVGEAADGIEAVDQAEETLPDVIVMDVGMPKRGGIEACRVIKQRVPSARILMLTSSDDEEHLFEAVGPGPAATCSRTCHRGGGGRDPGLRRAVAHLADDGIQAAPRVLQDQPTGEARLRPPPRARAAPPDGARARHPQARRRGKLNREIAGELFISENTVRNHIRNILDKLQMHSRMEAAMYAVRQRLIEPGE